MGKAQAAQAGEDVIQAFQEHNSNENEKDSTEPWQAVILLASDLLRAKETAEIVRDKLLQAGIPLVQVSFPEGVDVPQGLALEPRLRERWFGEWDESSDQNYPHVWKDDAIDPDHTHRGVESVNQVVTRTTSCICEWDGRLSLSRPKSQGEKYGRCMVICVAHGDVLQILQTAFAKMDPAKHRSLDHLETAKLRKLELKE